MFDLVLITFVLQALKSSKEVELVDEKIRCKTEPERWPIPTPSIVGSPRTDFSQLINCPEFVPRQTLSSTNSGQCPVTPGFFFCSCVFDSRWCLSVLSQSEPLLVKSGRLLVF